MDTPTSQPRCAFRVISSGTVCRVTPPARFSSVTASEHQLVLETEASPASFERRDGTFRPNQGPSLKHKIQLA